MAERKLGVSERRFERIGEIPFKSERWMMATIEIDLWNRKPHSGYRVIFVPFSGGKSAAGPVADALTGFITEEGNALGRPVGVAGQVGRTAGGR